MEFFRNNPPVTGIVVDAGVIGGRTYLSTYDIDTGIYKVCRLPFRHCSEVAELMAIAKGVSQGRWKETDGLVWIFCDNSHAVMWAVKRYFMDPTMYCTEDVAAYNVAMKVISQKARWVKVKPWYTRNFGPNPADYRFRKDADGFKGFVRTIGKKKRIRKRQKKSK